MADFSGSQAFQGGLGGAATGATLGAGFGPQGALIGGGIGLGLGLLGGGFGGDPRGDLSGQFGEQINALQGIPRDTGPSAAGLDIGQAQLGGFGGQFRSGQLDLISQLQAQSRGEGPSVAEKNRQLAQQDLLASQTAALATGGSRLGARGAAQNVQRGTQGLAGQAQLGRLQEQLQAQSQLGGVLGQGRAAEIQASQFNASAINNRALNQALLESQRRQFNVSAGLQAGLQGPNLGSQLLGAGGQILAGGVGAGAFNFQNQGGGGGPFNFQGSVLPGVTPGASGQPM